MGCGRDKQSACATFSGLWHHLMGENNTFPAQGACFGEENKTYPIPGRQTRLKKKIKLENHIKTGVDLIIQDMYLHCSRQKFTFHNSTSHLINITITNITIEETLLEFSGNNVSLNVENSIIITHSKFTNNSDLWLQFWMSFNSNTTIPNALITKCIFSNNSGLLMEAHEVKIRIENSQFLNNEDVGIIDIWGKGKVYVINSTFIGNHGVDGAVLIVREGSKVKTEQCIFLQNKAQRRGGVIAISYQSKYCDHDSIFANNMAGIAGKVQNQKS